MKKHLLAFFSLFIMMYAVIFIRIAKDIPQLAIGITLGILSLAVFLVYENNLKNYKK